MTTTIIAENASVSLVGNDDAPKPYDELTIADDFVFGKIYQDKERFKRLLEILLHIDIADISEPVAQKSYRVAPDRKRIVTDVSAESRTAEYDVEMQRKVRADLPRRARYYQSSMDVQFLQKKLGYTELKENYVIFICLADPFKRALPVYTFRNLCTEAPQVPLNDGTTKIFYNAPCYAKMQDKEARGFMEYVGTKNITTPYTATIDELVEEVRSNPLWRKEYMDVMQDYLVEKREQELRVQAAEQRGIATGEHNAKLAAAHRLLQMGLSVEQVAQGVGLLLADVQALALAPTRQ